MEIDYSIEIQRQLEQEFQNTALHRPMSYERYETGTVLTYDVTGVAQASKARVSLVVDKFVGGGFAGQVYRVKLEKIESEDGPIEGLEIGGRYAVKILIPPSNFSRLFRNVLYWIGFQGPFQLQVNPFAARAGALWQKFIRRAAKIRFGTESSVVDIYATFVDSTLGSCGELSEWVEGRTWRLEVDDRLDALKNWFKGRQVDLDKLGSPEYREKYEFMQEFVALLHQMGAHEFARQYEWSTWKSQPNCLKRNRTADSACGVLTAVDFRAGLALLPFLPMSPGDFKLIFTGLMRGSLVQFDRGDIAKLKAFITKHPHEFVGMKDMLVELEGAEEVYRDSIPDITHHHIRLVSSPSLWSAILKSALTGWGIRNFIDGHARQKLQTSVLKTLLFALLGFIPFIGRFFRRIWGQSFWRIHYRNILTSGAYFRRALRAKFIEKIIGWHRSGRVNDANAVGLTIQMWRCSYHWPISWLPAGVHRILTDWQYAKEKLDYILLRPVRLYFNNALREQWLRDMVTEGKDKHLLNDEDADLILSQIKEPYIQKYLKSLAVHVCTLPVTQVVSVIVAIIYVLMHPEMPKAQSYAIGLGIIALFQVIPISPGSLTRGLYVLYLVIREKNFKDYNIAVFLGFFKYIGYLAFPIQMTYRYPALARFMAGHWATEAVHVVPVFGERGALLEHKIFNLFYNWPLTIRNRIQKRWQLRTTVQPRYWHITLCVAAGVAIFVATDLYYLNTFGVLPNLKEVWFFSLIVPLVCGATVTLGAGGATISHRVIGAVICTTTVGIASTLISSALGSVNTIGITDIAVICLWRFFVFSILSVVGLFLTEIKLPEPEVNS
ncbi:MAG: hypothetical protein PVH42_09340 [Desulfobacterales bacterium]|jgi:hypothetical protein